MKESQSLIPENKIDLDFLKALLEVQRFKVTHDKKNKFLFATHKSFVPILVTFSKRNSLITIYSEIDARDDITELNLSKFIRSINYRSRFCRFNYSYSKKKANTLSAEYSIMTFNGFFISHFVFAVSKFCHEFLNRCFIKNSEKILYINRGKLSPERPGAI